MIMTIYDHIKVGEDVCQINGEDINDEQVELIYDWVDDHFAIIKNCPFCSTPLRSASYEKEKYGSESERLIYLIDSTLWSCDYCAYWQWYWHEATDLVLTNVYSEAFISKLRDFNEKLPEGFDSELSMIIRRNYRNWHIIDPTRLEKLIVSVLKANYGRCEVFHVGKPFDGGVDVIFIDSNNQQWLVQVKRREDPNIAEGVKTIRNLLGAMILEGSLNGVVISTADHFTYRAYEAVGRAREVGMTVKLIDRGKLNRMLDPILPDRPWRPVIKEISPNLHNYFSRRIPKAPQKIIST